MKAALLLLLLLPATSQASNLRTGTTTEPVFKLTAAELEKVGCQDECADKAKKLLIERLELNEVFHKFVQAVDKTLHVPHAEARIRTNLARDDLLGYVGNVWSAIAAGDVESAVTQQASIMERLEFAKRIDDMMNKTMAAGPNLALPRGLVGGPVPNRRCLSGVSLAGAIHPDGSSVCLPVAGFINNLPIKCALFGMVPNSVLKTLGDKDFKQLCETKPDCEYIRFQDDGKPGFCLARSNHLDQEGKYAISDESNEIFFVVGGLKKDNKCDSGYARAGTFDPVRKGPHCVDKKEADVSREDAAKKLGANIETVVDGKRKIQKKEKRFVVEGGNKNAAEDLFICTRRHQARLFGVSQLASGVRALRVECEAKRGISTALVGNIDTNTTTTTKEKCCDPPSVKTKEEREALACEKELVGMIQRKEAMDQDISACALTVHNGECDTLSPELQCGRKPWCKSNTQVSYFARAAEGTATDCCSSYKCLARGFSDGREKMMSPESLKTESICPDFSAVSPLPSLEVSGVGKDVLAAYKVACLTVKGCMYIDEFNTCV